ncbi:MAG: phosphopentomutase [Pseudomonadota bacterium]
MPRAVLIVMDSFGIGGAPDAAQFGDEGANTLAHVMEATGIDIGADRSFLPNLAALGLFDALKVASGHGKTGDSARHGFWGAATEVSKGKDTPSGHWEICGLPVRFDWGYFPHTEPAFSLDLLDAIYVDAALPGSLGNVHASGTEIIKVHGAEHVKSGKPIFYTSADSVLQIAAHEEHFGLERLYELCLTAKKHTDKLNIGRVIARPFVGESEEDFTRTGNRRDFSVEPTGETVLDRIAAAGNRTFAVGKISDIMAHRSIYATRKAHGNDEIGRETLKALDDSAEGDLVFSNFVDFDMLYGHRRDPEGYAQALRNFDAWLPSLIEKLKSDDLLIITADHGCDPTWHGTDHTRERVPVLGLLGTQSHAVSIGVRNTFADIAETIAAHLRVAAGPHGQSFLDEISPHDA